MVEREGSYNIEIIERGHLKIEVFIGRILVAMYVHCGLLAKAQIVFETLLTGSRLYFVLECTYFEIYPRGENEESSKMISSACTLKSMLQLMGCREKKHITRSNYCRSLITKRCGLEMI